MCINIFKRRLNVLGNHKQMFIYDLKEAYSSTTVGLGGRKVHLSLSKVGDVSPAGHADAVG